MYIGMSIAGMNRALIWSKYENNRCPIKTKAYVYVDVDENYRKKKTSMNITVT